MADSLIISKSERNDGHWKGYKSMVSCQKAPTRHVLRMADRARLAGHHGYIEILYICCDLGDNIDSSHCLFPVGQLDPCTIAGTQN